jgi:hypothetical protein
VDVDFDAAVRDLQHPGDLVGGEVGQVPQDDGLPLALREGPQRRGEDQPEIDIPLRVADRPAGGAGGGELCRGAAAQDVDPLLCTAQPTP